MTNFVDPQITPHMIDIEPVLNNIIEVEPVFNDVLVVPTPGVPGKDGQRGAPGEPGEPGRDGAAVMQETMRFTQNTPAQTWVVNHTLPQPISSCHIVTGGEPVMVSWLETQPGVINVFFASPCSGTVTIS